MKQRTDPLSWIEINPGNLIVDNFPDGSFRFSLECEKEPKWGAFHIVLKSTLPEAIVATYQVCTAVVVQYPDCKVHVEVQTFPDQRADRIEKPGMTNAALVSAKLIAGLPCDLITVHDLHSSVTRIVLENECQEMGVDLEIYEPIDDFVDTLYDVWPDEYTPKFDFVVAVDKGAEHRAEQVQAHFGSEIIYADKKRVNGHVVGHEILTATAMVNEDDTIWVVDDLCDGGATFISIAKVLRENYKFGDLNLYVTHGLFSKGKAELDNHFNNIIARYDYSDVG